MKTAWITPKNLAVAVGITLAFIGGRFSAPSGGGDSDVVEANQQLPNKPRSSSRRRAKRLSRISTPGAGTETIRTAEQLRGLFKQNGSNGLNTLEKALAKMNSGEFADLAADLADAHATNRGQANWYEIPRTFARWAEVDPEAALRFTKASDTQFHRTALQSVITTIAIKDAAYALKEAKQIQNPTLSLQIKSQVMGTMAASHPDVWISEILSDPNYATQYGYVGNYVSQWFEQNPEAAIARINKLPAHLVKNSVAQIGTAWASKDSTAALQWANRLESPQMKNQAVASIVSVIAKNHPEKAIALIENMPGGARNIALSSIYRTMAKTDPMGAFEQALALPHSADRYAALNSILNPNGYGGAYGYRSWNSHQYMNGQAPPLTMAQLQSMESRLPQGKLLDAVYGQITAHLMNYPPKQAQQLLNNYPEDVRAKMASHLIRGIHSTDPERALVLHQQFAAKNHQNYSDYSSLLGSLAKVNPEKAIKLALEENNENWRSNYLRNVINQMANQNPSELAQHITSIEDKKMREQAISQTASSWGASNPDAAMDWANNLPNNERFKALSAIIPSFARNSPQLAIRHYETLAASARGDKNKTASLTSIAGSIASSWSNFDPEAASAWASTLPDEKAQRYAVSAVVSSWAARDIEQTSQWVHNLPVGKTRDGGVKSLINTFSNQKPALAFEWADTISDEDQRRYSLGSIVRQWKQYDPEGARNAVENAKLTEKEYEYLTKQLKP